MKGTLSVLLFFVLFLSSCVIKVACVGDSITEGAGLKKQSQTGYPFVLNKLLGKRYEVLNSGRGGTTMLKKSNFPYWNCKELTNTFVFDPKIIVIKLGTNDTKPTNWKIGDFEKDYQAMIDTFKIMKSKPRIILCKPVPAFNSNWGINDSIIINGVIPVIERLAAKNKLQVVNLHSGLKDEMSNFPDGIHPNERASAKMAKIIAEEIKKNSLF